MAKNGGPRWLWRIALAALPTAAWFLELCPLPTFPGHALAHRIGVEVCYRCIVVGEMPSPEVVAHVEAVHAKRNRELAELGKQGIEFSCILFKPIDGEREIDDVTYTCISAPARDLGTALARSVFPGLGRGQRVSAIAFSLLGIPLSLFYLPLRRGLWLVLRRARRRRRNKCVTCGHSLHALESPCCPECGAPRPLEPAVG